MPELTEEEYKSLLLDFADAVDTHRAAFTDAVFSYFSQHSYPIALGTKLFMDLIKMMCESWNNTVKKVPDELK